MLEGEFDTLFKTLSQHLGERDKSAQRLKERLQAEQTLVDDMDSVLGYITSLFDEGQYMSAV